MIYVHVCIVTATWIQPMLTCGGIERRSNQESVSQKTIFRDRIGDLCDG